MSVWLNLRDVRVHALRCVVKDDEVLMWTAVGACFLAVSLVCVCALTGDVLGQVITSLMTVTSAIVAIAEIRGTKADRLKLREAEDDLTRYLVSLGEGNEIVRLSVELKTAAEGLDQIARYCPEYSTGTTIDVKACADCEQSVYCEAYIARATLGRMREAAR